MLRNGGTANKRPEESRPTAAALTTIQAFLSLFAFYNGLRCSSPPCLPPPLPRSQHLDDSTTTSRQIAIGSVMHDPRSRRFSNTAVALLAARSSLPWSLCTAPPTPKLCTLPLVQSSLSHIPHTPLTPTQQPSSQSGTPVWSGRHASRNILFLWSAPPLVISETKHAGPWSSWPPNHNRTADGKSKSEKNATR